MKKPVIAITASNIQSKQLEPITGDVDILYLDSAIVKAVVQAGGVPIILPTNYDMDEEELSALLQNVDGVILAGEEADTNPKYYGEQPNAKMFRHDTLRDKFDIQLVQHATKNSIPLLGICKGMQIINVALGGSLYQNLIEQTESGSMHKNTKKNRVEITHNATLVEDSVLSNIFSNSNQDTVLGLNGGHQQAVKTLASNLRPIAIAEDGVVEAFEARNSSFVLGLQFHAELKSDDNRYSQIFSQFNAVCASSHDE